jgi:tetratricopeptide (TPR) repeat protein
MLKHVLLVLLCVAFSQHSLAQSEKVKALGVEADTLLSRQDFEGARKLYTKVLKGLKEKDQFYYNLVYKRAVSSYSSGHFDEALTDLTEFIPAYPNFPQGLLLRAFIYREKGDADGQLNSLNKVLLLQPGSLDLTKWRASLYLDKGKYDSAIMDLQQVKLYQDDAELETYLGFAYYNTDEKDSAMICLNKAMALDVTYQPAYLYAGSFSLQEEAYDLALKYLNLALRLDPKNYTALFYKGIALVEKDKLDEGCSCLAKAFRLGADDAADYLKEYCYGDEN